MMQMNFGEIIYTLWHNHRGKLIGVVLGLVFGIMVVAFGFWQTLFIFICVFTGFFIGKKLDSKGNIGESFRQFFSRSN